MTRVAGGCAAGGGGAARPRRSRWPRPCGRGRNCHATDGGDRRRVDRRIQRQSTGAVIRRWERHRCAGRWRRSRGRAGDAALRCARAAAVGAALGVAFTRGLAGARVPSQEASRPLREADPRPDRRLAARAGRVRQRGRSTSSGIRAADGPGAFSMSTANSRRAVSRSLFMIAVSMSTSMSARSSVTFCCSLMRVIPEPRSPLRGRAPRGS